MTEKQLLSLESFNELAAYAKLTAKSRKIAQSILVNGMTGTEAAKKYKVCHQRSYAIIGQVRKANPIKYLEEQFLLILKGVPSDLRNKVIRSLKSAGLFVEPPSQ